MKKENKIINSYNAFRDAVKMRIWCQRKFWDEDDDTHAPDFLLAGELLNPKNLKNWVRNTSSFNHGANILNQVFPRSENPEDFHSNEFEIVLTERPFQVLGWSDVARLKKEGVNLGLDREWIDLGFEQQALRRGIDLEQHFFSSPSQPLDAKLLSIAG